MQIVQRVSEKSLKVLPKSAIDQSFPKVYEEANSRFISKHPKIEKC